MTPELLVKYISRRLALGTRMLLQLFEKTDQKHPISGPDISRMNGDMIDDVSILANQEIKPNAVTFIIAKNICIIFSFGHGNLRVLYVEFEPNWGKKRRKIDISNTLFELRRWIRNIKSVHLSFSLDC